MLLASVALWLVWNLGPSLVVSLGVLGLWYLLAVSPWRRWRSGDAPASRAQAVAFAAGWLTLVVALMSPLDALGDDYLFSAHMVQHMLIAVVAPPLLLLGLPAAAWEALLPGQRARQALRWLAHPVVAFGVFNADLWLWHAPALYDATLANAGIHVVEHLSFIVFGLLFWLPILGPAGIVPRISRPFAVLYLFLGCQPMVALGALLTFAAQPFYAPYVHDPRIWGISPLSDQQLGGLIMWLPTNIPYLIGLSVIFFRWVSEQDRVEEARAAAYDDGAPYELFPTRADPLPGEAPVEPRAPGANAGIP